MDGWIDGWIDRDRDRDKDRYRYFCTICSISEEVLLGKTQHNHGCTSTLLFSNQFGCWFCAARRAPR